MRMAGMIASRRMSKGEIAELLHAYPGGDRGAPSDKP